MGKKKRVGIIGAGVSGLLACKYLLSKGSFIPVVFESRDRVGGVWTKTIKSTKLQTPKSLYRFSDYPWPPSIQENFPAQKQVLEYIESYARHHNLFEHIELNTKVLSLSYSGPSEAEMMEEWMLWGGTGEPFGPEGKWMVTVQNSKKSHLTEVRGFDFVIVCAGMYSDSPSIPEFPLEKGPEAFSGRVMHSMEYSNMDHEEAAELVRDKRVAVVGFQKSAMDIAMECSALNGIKKPCTVIYRTEHWNVPDHSPWGVPLAYLYQSRFSQLLIHKPGEGRLLNFTASALSPLVRSSRNQRWGISKFVESYVKKKQRLEKHGMVPKHSFSREMYSCSIATAPEGFFDRVDEGNVRLKKARKFGFCSEGVLVDAETEPLKIDVLILATGFRGAEKIKAAFSSRALRDLLGSVSEDNGIPLYRECIHPRIPQLAFIGVSESIANLFTSELTCRWLTELLDGAFTVPSIKEMEKNVSKWEKHRKKSLGEGSRRSCLCALQIWYNDLLCKDMKWRSKRKKGLLRETFEPYGPSDYYYAS